MNPSTPVARSRNGRLAAICLPVLALALCITLANCGPNTSGSGTSGSGTNGSGTTGSGTTSSGTTQSSPSSPTFSGTVHGAQQPISGSLIQLYAVGATGDASSATPLLSATLTTSDGTGAANSNANAGNANNSLPAGSFTVPGYYVCPSQTAPVYLVVTGGNPGLTPGTPNQQIALMAALGACGNITSSTTVAVNELTTIGSIAPLFSFMNSASAVGYSPSDATQFTAALAQVPEYINVGNGTVPGSSLPSGYYASGQLLQTLGDILASCIHSTGGAAGDSTPCGQLFRLATPQGAAAPVDTIQATIDILKNPTTNAASIYRLVAAGAPFQPIVPVAPASWSLPIAPLPTTFSVALNSTSDFIGASIINYWPLPLHNNGIATQTSSQVLARFSSDVLNHGYARVIILCGTNDVLGNDPNLATELPANLQAMAQMATNAGIEVVLSELPPLVGGSASYAPQLTVANAAIVQLAKQHGYLLVDFYTPLVAHPEDLPDGVHPNAAGYALMETALSGVVLY